MTNIVKKEKLQVVAFQTYGTGKHLYVRGRALQDEVINLEQKGFWSILKNTWKRFETDEIRHAQLQLSLPDGRILELQTDLDGYFILDNEIDGLGKLINEEGWLPYEIAFGSNQLKRENIFQNRFPGEMLIPGQNVRFGIISDIDDTILHTGLTSFMKLGAVFNTLFKSASSRIPLEGAAQLYHTLHRGISGEEANPIFYVSNSPWNLYRYLEYFLKLNNFPKGPILLRSFRALMGNRKNMEKPHKQHEISNILKTYPELPFVLIGDSGEHDPDIYMEMAEAFPNRIKAIYLRNVRHRKKMLRVKDLFSSYKKVPVLFVAKSEEAESHAREIGLI